jgi:hypothetical protein
VTRLCLRPGTFSFVSDDLHGLGQVTSCGAVISLSNDEKKPDGRPRDSTLVEVSAEFFRSADCTDYGDVSLRSGRLGRLLKNLRWFLGFVLAEPMTGSVGAKSL